MAPSSKVTQPNIRGHSVKRIGRLPRPKVFAIPYFAHQQLDVNRYGDVESLALPVGKPGWAPAPVEIATASNGGWDEENDLSVIISSEDEASSAESIVTTVRKPRATKKEPRNPYKRLRVAGGRPAVAKKVTADLDSDDELIVRMKNAKYLEKDIAKRLAEEGRTAYNPKTIGTRWARIRKALAIRNDELLDADMTDWHDGDDDALNQAYQRAHKIVERTKAEAEERRWRLVADQLKSIKPVTNFSQNACRTRYESLQQGTAKPTPESIADPDEGTIARIQSRQEKEARIKADTKNPASIGGSNNLEGNAWTSKSRRWA